MKLNSRKRFLLKTLSRKYIWWDCASKEPVKTIAQVLDKGSVAEIKHMLYVLGARNVDQELKHIKPGWVSDKRWEYYHKVIRNKNNIPALPVRIFTDRRFW